MTYCLLRIGWKTFGTAVVEASVKLEDLVSRFTKSVDKEPANLLLVTVSTMGDVGVMLPSYSFHPLHSHHRLETVLTVTGHDGDLILLKELRPPENTTDSCYGGSRDKRTNTICDVHVQLTKLLIAQT